MVDCRSHVFSVHDDVEPDEFGSVVDLALKFVKPTECLSHIIEGGTNGTRHGSMASCCCR